jgi:hypothetical protein
MTQMEQDMAANREIPKRFYQSTAAAFESGDPKDVPRRGSARPQRRRLMTIHPWTRPFAAWRILVAIFVGLFALPFGSALGQGAGVQIDEPQIPEDVDVFELNLEQTRALSRSLNFKVVGQSYLKGPWLTAKGKAKGTGVGLNSVYVHDGIAYVSGYSDPPAFFGNLIVDVHDPKDMKVLGFVPCEPGARCTYQRVNINRHILVTGASPGMPNAIDANPIQPRGGRSHARAGFSFTDVSNPKRPKPLGFFLTTMGGATHDFAIDDNFVYACASMPESKKPAVAHQELVIIDYRDPKNPKLAGRLHLPGQHVGEEPGVRDRLNPDGTPQKVWCQQITIHKNRLYVGWRDAGLGVVDVTDPSKPRLVGQLDYVPPFNGGAMGAAHSAEPVVVDPNEHPDLVVLTDESFDCPPGIGRIVDVSDLKSPDVEKGLRDANLQIISSYRIPHVSDVFNFDKGKFECLRSPGDAGLDPEHQGGQQSVHYPWFDHRSPSLFYQTWYDQGLRVWDISNPFLPREVGYYLPPKYASFGYVDRQTREVFQDPDTDLIYVTDGNGGGLTVLEWTGPIQKNPPIPGAR